MISHVTSHSKQDVLAQGARSREVLGEWRRAWREAQDRDPRGGKHA